MNTRRLYLLFLAAFSALSLHAQVRVIDDPSITAKRLRNSTSALLTISGRSVDLVFLQEAVEGSIVLTVWEVFDDSTEISTYRYLGQEGNIIRFALDRRIERRGTIGMPNSEKLFDVVIAYAMSPEGRYRLVPEALQYTKYYFQLIPSSQRSVLQASLETDGPPQGCLHHPRGASPLMALTARASHQQAVGAG